MSIGYLPDATLTSIFFLAVKDYPVTLPSPAHDARLALSHVCLRWKNLVLEHPKFWTHIRFLPKPVRRPDYLKKITESWLSRSKEESLDLYFKRETENDGGNVGQKATLAYELLFSHGMVDTVYDVLIPVGLRIRSLNWTICTEGAIKSFLEIPAGTFKRIESIQLTFFNEFYRSETYFSDYELRRFSVFRGLPKLRDVTIQILNGINPLRFKLPLRHITTLDLGYTSISPHTFMSIIYDSAPSLVHGRFSITFKRYSKYDPEYRDIQKARGRHIETLRLRLIEPSKDERIFRRLTLPSIRELRIYLHDPKRGWKPSIITDILQKSSTTLQALMLSDFPPLSSIADKKHAPRQRKIHHAELVNLFKTVPNLRVLYLSYRLFVHPATLEQIAAGNLLPRLQFLSLTSLSGRHVHALSAIRRRNELSLYYLRYPGGSNMFNGANHIFPTALIDVIMGVPKEDKSELEDEVKALRRLAQLRDTQIDILGEDIRNFRLNL